MRMFQINVSKLLFSWNTLFSLEPVKILMRANVLIFEWFQSQFFLIFLLFSMKHFLPIHGKNYDGTSDYITNNDNDFDLSSLKMFLISLYFFQIQRCFYKVCSCESVIKLKWIYWKGLKELFLVFLNRIFHRIPSPFQLKSRGALLSSNATGGKNSFKYKFMSTTIVQSYL